MRREFKEEKNMKMKRFFSLVISMVMTISAFSGLTITSAAAEEGDTPNTETNTISWFAKAADGTPIEGIPDDGTADCAIIAANTNLMSGTDCELIIMGETKYKTVAFNGTDESGNKVETPAGLTGRLAGGGRGDAADNGTTGTGLKFTPNADGVIDVYAKVNNGKTFVVNTADASEKTVWVNNDGTNAQKRISAPVKANNTYYIYAQSSGVDLFGLVFRAGAEYVPPVITTKEPTAPPTIDPNAKIYEWNVSSVDLVKKKGDLLMTGLSLVFDNTSTNNKYISCGDNGKIDKNAESEDLIVTGAALKFVAPENGKLEVKMIDLGTSVKPITPVIYDLQAGKDVFSYTTSGDKETVNCVADVEEGKIYYITATGTKGRFAAAKFTPSADATDTPEIPTTDKPNTGGITYENGVVTVKADDASVTSGVLIIASYNGEILADIKTESLTFTVGADTKELALVNGTKLMVWDSFEGMKPLCSSYIVTGSSVTPDPTQSPSGGGTVNTVPKPVPVSKNVITVDASQETNADTKTYKTVTEGLAAAKDMNGHTSEADRITMNIVPGTYREQINVDVPYLTMKKAEGTTGDVLLTWYYGIGYQYYSTGSDGYYSKSVYETNKAAGTVAARGVDAWGCATRINASDFYAEDIIFENSFNRYMTEEEIADGVTPAEPKSAAYSDGVGKKPERKATSKVYNGDFTERAAAIAIDNNNAERVAFYNCQFLSSQDTLYTGSKSNRIYFRDCVIEGQTDYIFGGNTCVFDNCDFNWAGFGSSPKGGHITAVKNASTQKGYLLYGGSVNAASTQGGQFVVGDFGRPWGGNDSPTAAIGVKINNLPDGTSSIAPAGWGNWSTPAKESQYYEYGTLDAGGKKIDLTNRNALVPNEWDMLAFNPYRYLIKDGDNWDPMNVKSVWEPVIAKLGEVVIPDSETIKKTAVDAYEVSGQFTLPANPEGYELNFKSNSDYLVVNADNTVTAVRPISGTSEASLKVYIRKADNTYVGTSKTINLTITADSTVDPEIFNASMNDAKSAITALMGSDAAAVLDRAVPVPAVAEKDGVVTTIRLANEGGVNADGTIARNPYESDAAKGKVTYIIECKKGVTLLRDTVTYDVTIPSKKGDLLYADFEDNATAVGGTVKKDGSNSGYYVNGAVSADLAKASSKSPVTVEFDVKKADTTVTLGKYTKTIAAAAMQDGWNKVKLVVDTTTKTMTAYVNGTALGATETVAGGETSVNKFALSAGNYDNITVFEGENNADGSKVYTTFWKASAADKGKTKDTVIMRGMTLMADMGSGAATSATIDGETFDYYITGADNGGWTNGIAKDGGVGLKFVAPADGTWTVYLVDLGSNKTFYLGSPDKEVKAEGTQGAKHALSIEVKGGMTYYATVAGSKGRFVGSKYVPTIEGGPKFEPEKPIENALNIIVDFMGQSAYKYYNTEENIEQNTLTTFSLDKDGNIVSADAENAVAKFENVRYHSSDHGVNAGTVTVQVPGYTKITVGGCAWGSDIVLKKGADEIDRAKNAGKCYHSDNSAVSFVYYKENTPAELTLPINGYWPYISIESITEAEIPNEVTATFTLGDGQGTVPSEMKVRKGKTITIPANRGVYKDGNTLTGWTDGTKTYTEGQEIILNDNMTLTPVFTANTKIVSNTSVIFDFQTKNGAPTVGWENKSDAFWVGQAIVDGTPIDVKMDIDTTPKTLHNGTTGQGKVANANWTDWAQINQCTEFTLQAVAGTVIEIDAMGADTKLEIGANQFNKEAGYTVKAEDITGGKVKMLNVGGGYTRTIKVTYPEVVQTTTEPTTEPTEEPVEFTTVVIPAKDITAVGNANGTPVFMTNNTPTDPTAAYTDEYKAIFGANFENAGTDKYGYLGGTSNGHVEKAVNFSEAGDYKVYVMASYKRNDNKISVSSGTETLFDDVVSNTASDKVGTNGQDLNIYTAAVKVTTPGTYTVKWYSDGALSDFVAMAVAKTEDSQQPTPIPTVQPDKDVTVSGTVTLTGIYNNKNNKKDLYKMKAEDIVLTLTPSSGEAVTATVTGVQDGDGENALSYTATVKAGSGYTVALGDKDGNTYNITSGNSVTPAEDTANNISAVKTYSYQVPLTIGAGALEKFAAENITKLYVSFGKNTIKPIEVNVSDITAGEKFIATGHNMTALDTDGTGDNWTKAMLSTSNSSVTLPAGMNKGESNQDSIDATGTFNPPVRFQDIRVSLLVSGITLTPVEAEGVWEYNNEKVVIHPNNTLTVNAAIAPSNADNKNVDWSATAVTAGAAGVTVNGGTVTVAEDATGGSEWTIKATSKDGSNVTGTITIQVVDSSDSLGNVSITDAGKAVVQVVPGKTVTAAVSPKDGVDTSALTYKWLSAPKGSDEFTEIIGANEATYAIPADMAEKSTLKVVVSASGYGDAEATVEVTNLPIMTVDSFTTSGLAERGAWTISDSQAKTYADMGSPLGDLNQYTKYIDNPANTTVTIPETGTYKLYMLFREYSNRGYAATFDNGAGTTVKAVCLQNMPKVATEGSTNYTVSSTDVTLDAGTYTVSFDRSKAATGGGGDGTKFMAFVLIKAE